MAQGFIHHHMQFPVYYQVNLLHCVYLSSLCHKGLLLIVSPCVSRLTSWSYPFHFFSIIFFPILFTWQNHLSRFLSILSCNGSSFNRSLITLFLILSLLMTVELPFRNLISIACSLLLSLVTQTKYPTLRGSIGLTGCVLVVKILYSFHLKHARFLSTSELPSYIPPTVKYDRPIREVSKPLWMRYYQT